MPTFNPRVFTKPDRLKNIAAHNLVALFDLWPDYLPSRGLSLSGHPDGFPFEQLSSVLMTPNDHTPPDLIDALYFIDESATDFAIEDLLEIAKTQEIDLGAADKLTPADVAVRIWLAKPQALKDTHARAVVFNQKRFVYFGGGADEPKKFPEVTEEKTLAIQASFDDWFGSRRKGRGTRVFTFRRDKRVWMLVRHGLPMRREGNHQDTGETETEFYRPQQHDVLVYDEQTGEIGVHTSTKGETELYLHTIGFILFDDPDHFPPAAKYSFDPLLNDGPAALACDDIDGIDRILLVEIQRYWPGPFGEREIRKANDLFGAFGDKWSDRLAPGKLSGVVFRVWFTGSKKDRSVTVRTPNIARYDRNEDSDVIERWLVARGFCKGADETIQ